MKRKKLKKKIAKEYQSGKNYYQKIEESGGN